MADFEFEPDRALAATAYLAQQSGETMYTILKMVYVADRMHLEKYGRPITGDTFFALKEGACPSKIYDSMKAIRGDGGTNYLPGSEKLLRVDAQTFDVEIRGMPDMDALSESDVECLNETIDILKNRGRWHMRDLAHDSAWKGTTLNARMLLTDIADSVDSTGTLSNYLATR